MQEESKDMNDFEQEEKDYALHPEKALVDLQKIEAGIISVLPYGLDWLLQNARPRYKNGNIKKQFKFPDKPVACMICNIDIVLCHHINIHKSPRKYNGDMATFDGWENLIWICPNCHHKIHNANPYFANGHIDKGLPCGYTIR